MRVGNKFPFVITVGNTFLLVITVGNTFPLVITVENRLPLVIIVENLFLLLITVGKNNGSSFFQKNVAGTSEMSSMGHCILIILYTRICLNELLIWKKNLLQWCVA